MVDKFRRIVVHLRQPLRPRAIEAGIRTAFGGMRQVGPAGEPISVMTASAGPAKRFGQGAAHG